MKKCYQYHKPSSEVIEKMALLRLTYSTLHTMIEKEAPPSRELSLALTKLEESAMWCFKAMTHNDSKSVVE